MFAFCLLVPGGRATRTRQAVDLLQGLMFYSSNYSKEYLLTLLSPYLRFPEQKINRLLAFKQDWTIFYMWLSCAMKKKISILTLRDEIVDRLDGFGMKAASHALRNLGYTNLAVIDTHILKYAKYWLPGCNADKIDYPTSPKQYIQMETYFRRWAQTRFKLDPCLLDWYIWCKESGNAIDSLEC
jgi:N-glycosylase/DNA lyase